jgi:hypothetical protein
VRAVDVEHIEGERDVGDALCLGHELLGEDGRRDHVEDVDALERDRALAAQVTGRLGVIGAAVGRRRGLRVDRREQAVPVGEVPVQRRPRHAGGRRDVGGRRRGRLLEQATARVDDPRAGAARVRALSHSGQWSAKTAA